MSAAQTKPSARPPHHLPTTSPRLDEHQHTRCSRTEHERSVRYRGRRALALFAVGHDAAEHERAHKEARPVAAARLLVHAFLLRDEGAEVAVEDRAVSHRLDVVELREPPDLDHERARRVQVAVDQVLVPLQAVPEAPTPESGGPHVRTKRRKALRRSRAARDGREQTVTREIFSSRSSARRSCSPEHTARQDSASHRWLSTRTRRRPG
eukprot:42068-Rhodomonas_salina.1